MNILVVLGVGVILQLTHQTLVRDDKMIIEMQCDPRVDNRLEKCPMGYCCVRDEFLPSYVYCKKMGVRDESCTTKNTESACPCTHGLRCEPNIHQDGITSLYGECKPDFGPVNIG